MENQKPPLPKHVGQVAWNGPADHACAVSGLPHYVRLPKAAGPDNRVPVVVMSHGWGGNEAAMWLFARLVPPGAAIVTPRGPLELDGGGAMWFDHEGQREAVTASVVQGVAALERFITCLPSLYPVDARRLVLVGFSQGAMVGNALAMMRPDAAIGVASLAGALPALPPGTLPDALLPGLPVFIAHGTQDSTIPLAAAWQTREAFRRLGADVTYGEYAVGHKMNTPAMTDLQAWLAGVLA